MCNRLTSTKRLTSVFAGILVGLSAVNTAGAANPENVTAEVAFVDPITITENSALRFGLLDQNLADTQTVAISTSSAVTDASSRVIGGTQAAANLTVAATASQGITIVVDNVTNGTGYALGSFVCSYNGGSSAACGGSGLSATSAASATLLIGATLTGNGLSVTGTANGSFDVTVSYQ